MKTQIKHLQEERMEIEALSEQLTLSKPDGVQGMLDACRLTELRLMCIEEERRLTVRMRRRDGDGGGGGVTYIKHNK